LNLFSNRKFYNLNKLLKTKIWNFKPSRRKTKFSKKKVNKLNNSKGKKSLKI